MPQFSEEYLKNKHDNPTHLLEGYFSHFLRISEYVEEFSFSAESVTMEFKLVEENFIKIFREIEEINSPTEVVERINELPDEYEVKIGEVIFKFTKF